MTLIILTQILINCIKKRKDYVLMHKKILRILSVVLLLTLFAGMLPATETSAVGSDAERISKLAASTYRQALKKTGRRSFHGWCGAAVDWQMRALGITTKVVGSDGNDKYDYYKKLDYTSGGYKIKAYSKSKYNLEAALNAITENGTKDAYNIMVGFQWTNTSAGRKYGHAVFIYGIIDGIVYFTESFGMNFGGKYYPEGKCISGTIEQFAKSYNTWCRLDGVIHFGLKTYEEECEFLNAYLYANATKETTLYSAPCATEVDERSQPLRQVQVGERLSVTGLYLNTAGEYWYRVEDAQTGYVRADDTVVESMRYDDVTISSVKAPAVLKQGSSFNLKGKLTGTYVSLVSVRAQVYTMGEEGMNHVMTTNATVLDNEYSLYKSTVAKRLSFKLLELGNYHFELAVVAQNHYYADGSLQTQWQTIKLWLSDFQVVEQKGETANVTFDACGGTSQLNAAEMTLGQPLSNLPQAQRDGYVFGGWYTEAGELVDDSYILEEKMTLYARWIEADDVTGWYSEDGRAYYVQDGVRLQGFFQVDGITYHQNEEGFLDIGWTEIGGERYYFNANGSMVTGWLALPEGTYYMGIDGTMVIGWLELDGESYCFGEDGTMLTGKQTIDGKLYLFGEDGKLATNGVGSQVVIKDNIPATVVAGNFSAPAAGSLTARKR